MQDAGGSHAVFKRDGHIYGARLKTLFDILENTIVCFFSPKTIHEIYLVLFFCLSL